MAKKGSHFNPLQRLQQLGKQIRTNVTRLFKPKVEQRQETIRPKPTQQHHVISKPPEQHHVAPKKKIKPVQTETIQVQRKVEPKKESVEQKRQQYIPPKEEQLRQERINTDSSFYSDAIIANYRNQLRQYPAMAEPMLTNWLDYMIAEHGKDDVAKMLEDGAKNGVVLTFEIAYSEDKLVGYIADLMDWLPEMTDWYKAELMEQFEMWEEIE